MARLKQLAEGTILPTLSSNDAPGVTVWDLETADGRQHSITHEARIACADFAALREAAIYGLGVAFLPDHVCEDALSKGQLVRMYPNWRGREGIVHLVFTTRTGLPVHVRAWIDHLAEMFKDKALFGPL